MIDRKARNQFAEILAGVLAGDVSFERFDRKMLDIADNSQEIAIWTI